MFLTMLVPFVLVNNLYPCFRFGMFAEPIRNTVSVEKLLISFENSEGQEYIFFPAVIGLSEGHFSYVVRSYYYQGNIQQLFSQLHSIQKKSQKIKQWDLYRLQISSTSPTDTSHLQTWLPRE